MDILGQFNLEYETVVIGRDISEEQYEVLMGAESMKICPRVLMRNNLTEERLRRNSRGEEWMNMGSVEDTKKFLFYHNNIDSFN